VSPQSRRRGQAGNVAPPNALFDEFLHAARELLAVRSPLDAELLVSDLLGTWWPQRHHTIGGAGIEQLADHELGIERAAHREQFTSRPEHLCEQRIRRRSAQPRRAVPTAWRRP